MIRRLVVLLSALVFSLSLSSFQSPGTPPEVPNANRLKSLSAVMLVGPQEDGTAQAIEGMDKIADFLEEKGLTVYKFYDQDTDWEAIKNAAKNASFLIYSGHGSRMGENGAVGGLILSHSHSSKKIKEELRMKKNAVVLFKSVCNGAGSSADDDGDIGIAEAVRRVSDYSLPFFSTGAACYYANNLGNGCLDFLEYFFEGKDLETCFEETSKTWAKIEYSKTYKSDGNKKLGIASTDWGGTVTRTTYTNGEKVVEEIPSSKDYDIAFVGDPEFTIEGVLNGR
ncbi:MAG: hypothetical protein JW801_05695 [Bacteroidales bacterium]|nr:hypothetical protein [Bacteroidales bacterium]